MEAGFIRFHSEGAEPDLGKLLRPEHMAPHILGDLSPLRSVRRGQNLETVGEDSDVESRARRITGEVDDLTPESPGLDDVTVAREAEHPRLPCLHLQNAARGQPIDHRVGSPGLLGISGVGHEKEVQYMTESHRRTPFVSQDPRDRRITRRPVIASDTAE